MLHKILTIVKTSCKAILVLGGAVFIAIFTRGHLISNKDLYDSPEMPKCSSFTRVNVALLEAEAQTQHAYVDASRLVEFTSEDKKCRKDTYGCDIENMRGLSQLDATMPTNPHGTLMLSILTSSSNPEVKVAVIKIPLNPEQYVKHVQQSLEYAARRGIKVVVFPSGTSLPENYKTMPYDKIYTHKYMAKVHKHAIIAMQKFPGVIVVCSGNQGANLNRYPVFPASFAGEIPNLLVVANANADNHLSEFSNYGRMVQIAITAGPTELAAPCSSSSLITKIFSPFFFCIRYTDVVGYTSEASGYAGRLVAEMMSVNPALTVKDTIRILRSTGSSLVTTNEAQQQTVVINPERALAEAAQGSSACKTPSIRRA